jgi:hypothetical protein
MSRSSRFSAAGVAAVLAGLWSFSAVAQENLPPDIAGVLLADPNACWSFQHMRYTGRELAAELNKYTGHELEKKRSVPVKIERSTTGEPVLNVRVLGHIDQAKLVPCRPPAAAVPSPGLQVATLPPPELSPQRKIRVGVIGGGAYLNHIDVNSSSGFYNGDTQGGATATLWGGQAFIDIMPVSLPVLGSSMLSIGVVVDQTNAQLDFHGSCGGFPCAGANGKLSETAVIGELNLAFPLGGGNVYNWYAGGGVVFKKPQGNPTGFGGPGIEGSDTAAAFRIGGTLMHNFTDNFAAGGKIGYQWAGSTNFTTTLPGEHFHFGREGEMIFALVATFSFPIPGAPPP